jgi:hypothetical protein
MSPSTMFDLDVTSLAHPGMMIEVDVIAEVGK